MSKYNSMTMNPELQFVTEEISPSHETKSLLDITKELEQYSDFNKDQIYINENGEQILWEQENNIEFTTENNNYVFTDGDNNNAYSLVEVEKFSASLSAQLDQTILLQNHSENGCENEEINFKCTNCDVIFTNEQFAKHICEYDENKIFISDDYSSFMQIPVEQACIQQLRQNNMTIRKFLKDGLKIELKNYSSKQDGPHECNMCERKFVHASGLNRHLEKHSMDFVPNNNFDKILPTQVVIKCLICGRVFPDNILAIKHLEENHEENSDDEDLYTTDEEETSKTKIERAFKTIVFQKTREQEKKEFKNTKENDYLTVIALHSILQCEFCDYLFETNSSLFLHEASHDPSLGYECTACNINVFTSKEIITHWQIECANIRDATRKVIKVLKYYACNICEKNFSTLDQLYDHRYISVHLFPRLNRSLRMLEIGCEICGIFYGKAKSIMLHNEERHSKIFKTESIVKARPYLCDVCGKSYTQSSHLWQHLRFHRGVKPFACKEAGCTRRFTIRPDLNDHIRKCHTGERPYHCIKCGKRFLTGSVFYQHRLIHRGERRYGCHECGKRFYRADALKNHQRIHSGEKPYPCQFCPKSFRQRGDRDKHIRARHSLEVIKSKNHIESGENIITESTENVVYVGKVAFPKSMFEPIIKDIDAI